MREHYDVVIIGAGVVGCAIAHELSRYKLTIAVLEKDSDVASGTSGRNSGVVHAGFNCAYGTIKADLCVVGCLEFGDVCKELDVPFRRIGKLVTALDQEGVSGLEKLKKMGEKNGVPGLEIIDQAEIKKLDPFVSGIAALYSPNTGITNPFLFTVALAENAHENGASFYFDTKVTSIISTEKGFRVRAGKRQIDAVWVINCAGLYADRIARMVGINEYKIYPCRGEYYILDKRIGQYLNMLVYPVPKANEGGLGVHLTPTIEGSILVGPSAEYIRSREDTATTQDVMQQLFLEAKQLLPYITEKDFIHHYSGIRPKLTGPLVGGFEDFIIEDRKDVAGFINLLGIESPGLTSAVPISRLVVSLLNQKVGLERKKFFRSQRKGIIRFRELTDEAKQRLIQEDPSYGEIICRCESITKGEIRSALQNPLGVKTLTGIKYRAHAMMGRCQGGYCLTRITELLMKEGALTPEEICERGPASYLFTGRARI